jgi:hypothetical protein
LQEFVLAKAVWHGVGQLPLFDSEFAELATEVRLDGRHDYFSRQLDDFSGALAVPVIATEHPRPAAVHRRAAGAILRRRDVVRIGVGHVALTVDYYLTGLANGVLRVRDGVGCADDYG